MRLTKTRGIRTIATGLLVGFGLTGPAAAQTYTVGTSAAPFGFVDSAGEPAGYAVDVMGAIAEDAGLDLTFIVFPTFGELLPALLDGRVDIVASATGITAGRVDMGIAFSGVYARHTDALHVLGADTRPYTSVNEFAGEAIGSGAGNIYWDYLSELQASGSPFKEVVDINASTGLSGFVATAEALRRGTVKAVLGASFGLPFAQLSGEFSDIRAVETYQPVLPSATAIAVRRADTDLLGVIQASLSKLMANGTLAHLTGEWGINPP